MDRVVELLTAQGVDAAVSTTGGQCLAIFAGPMRDRPGVCEGDGWQVAAAVAGPGWTDRETGRNLVDTLDLHVGPDGQNEVALDVGGTGADSEEKVAALIAAQAKRDDPSALITRDEMLAALASVQ